MANAPKLRRLIRRVVAFYFTAISIFAPLKWLYSYAKEAHLLKSNWQQLCVAVFSYVGDVYWQAFKVFWDSFIPGFWRFAWLAVFLGFVCDRFVRDEGAQFQSRHPVLTWTGRLCRFGIILTAATCLTKGLMRASSRERAYVLATDLGGHPWWTPLSPHGYHLLCAVTGGIVTVVAYGVIGWSIRELVLILKEEFYDEPTNESG